MKIGFWLYGYGSSHQVQRIPFGLHVKACRGGSHNEVNALNMVQKYTDIPAPRLVDVVEYRGEIYMVMAHLPGETLHEVFHLMSYPERNRFADDLSACVAQLRKIPNNTPYLFANTLGGELFDRRIPTPPTKGPYNSEADFYDCLTTDLDCTAAELFGERYHKLRQDHRSVFTHSDFYHLNLLVESGRLSGIVDWECAGFMPEYWEFTKAMWFQRWLPDWEALYRRAFGGQYEEELKTEAYLWRLTPFP